MSARVLHSTKSRCSSRRLQTVHEAKRTIQKTSVVAKPLSKSRDSLWTQNRISRSCCAEPIEDIPEEATDRFPARRVLLKISGEALRGDSGCGINPTVLRNVALEIRESYDEGIQIAIVVGGGNFFRGTDAFEGLDRVTADYVGMLATVMNAICLQSVLESMDVPTRLQTAIEVKEVAEPYIRRRAIRHLEKKRVVIFGAGTGNPFFTTDMAAALRAAEINAHEVLKATKVNGVFSSDPEKNPNAKFLDHLTYDQAIQDHLNVMDHTALSLCRKESIPIRIFNIFEAGNIRKAILGEDVGSKMCHQEKLVKRETVLQSQLRKMENSVTL